MTYSFRLVFGVWIGVLRLSTGLGAPKWFFGADSGASEMKIE